MDDVKKEQAEARAWIQGAPPATALSAGGYARLIKLKFSTFSGADPTFYDMPVELWVRVASMHMEGRADLWMMTYEMRHDLGGWDQFCQAVESKFGTDDYQKYLMALMEVRQEWTVR